MLENKLTKWSSSNLIPQTFSTAQHLMRDCNLSSQTLKEDQNEQLNTPIFLTIGSSCIYASLAHQFNLIRLPEGTTQ
jgi:hypothetical protein